MHFAAFAYVGESVTRPGDLLPQQRRRHALAARRDARGRGRDDRLLVDLRGVRHSRGRADPRDDRQGCRSILTARPSSRSSAHCTGTATPMACATWRCAISTRPAPIPDGEIGEDHDPETHLIPLVLRAALGTRRPLRDLRHRLSDARTARRSATTSMSTDLADAHVRALGLSRGGRREHGAQSRNRQRPFGARGHRGRRARRRPHGAAARGAAPAGRPARARRRSGARPRASRLAARDIPIWTRSCAPRWPGRRRSAHAG